MSIDFEGYRQHFNDSIPLSCASSHNYVQRKGKKLCFRILWLFFMCFRSVKTIINHEREGGEERMLSGPKMKMYYFFY